MTDPELPESIAFEWDEHNRTKIRLRHNITPEEAEQAFFNSRRIVVDQKHSATEQRYQLLGINNVGKILFIVFTIRRRKIRVISARNASKKERANYDKKA